MKLLIFFFFAVVVSGAQAEQGVGNAFDKFVGTYNVSEIQIANDNLQSCDWLGFSKLSQFKIEPSEFGPMAIFTAPQMKTTVVLNEFSYKNIWFSPSGNRAKIDRTQFGAKRTADGYNSYEDQLSSIEIYEQNSKLKLNIVNELVQGGKSKGTCSYSATLVK